MNIHHTYDSSHLVGRCSSAISASLFLVWWPWSLRGCSRVLKFIRRLQRSPNPGGCSNLMEGDAERWHWFFCWKAPLCLGWLDFCCFQFENWSILDNMYMYNVYIYIKFDLYWKIWGSFWTGGLFYTAWRIWGDHMFLYKLPKWLPSGWRLYAKACSATRPVIEAGALNTQHWNMCGEKVKFHKILESKQAFVE